MERSHAFMLVKSLVVTGIIGGAALSANGAVTITTNAKPQDTATNITNGAHDDGFTIPEGGNTDTAPWINYGANTPGRVGAESSAGRNLVFLFHVPKAIPGDPVAKVNLTFTVESYTAATTGDFNADLYLMGEPLRPYAQVDGPSAAKAMMTQRNTLPLNGSGRYFEGDSDTTQLTYKIQDNLFTPANTGGAGSNLTLTTSEEASVLLAGYMNAFYATTVGQTYDPAVANPVFFYIRLNPDADAEGSTNDSGYLVHSGGATGEDFQYRPYMTVITESSVPEPVSGAMLLLVGAGMLRARRRASGHGSINL